MPPRPPPILLFGRIIPPPCPSPCSVADLPLPSLAHSTSDDEDPVNNLCLGDASIALVAKAQMDPSFPSHHAHSPPRKPDQLVPCPRCHNFDTKFCYFNNYNVKQPRHFCRSCQRYWTAGGTLRNVPVGAGRRKNKTPVNPTKSHPEIATPRSAFQVPQITKENSNRGLEAPFIDVMNSNATGSSTTSYGQPPQILSSGLENFTGMGAQDAAAKKPELQPVKQESRCSSSETELQASEVVSRWQTEGGKSLHEAEGVATRNWGVPWPYLGMMGWPGMPSPQNHTTGNGAETWAWPEGFFPWPAIVAPVWTPYGFTLPWNFAWNNGAPARGNMSTTPLQGEEDDDDEKEGSLCCPKARRIHQETVTCAHAFQLLRAHNNKLHLQSQHHHHSNPAAQARSAAFREGS